MARYGLENCKHVWRYRKDGYLDSSFCVPTICIECGAFGCECDIENDKPEKDIFFAEGQNSDANINGKWVNPYIER
jgi:hypothetical protein